MPAAYLLTSIILYFGASIFILYSFHFSMPSLTELSKLAREKKQQEQSARLSRFSTKIPTPSLPSVAPSLPSTVGITSLLPAPDDSVQVRNAKEKALSNKIWKQPAIKKPALSLPTHPPSPASISTGFTVEPGAVAQSAIVASASVSPSGAFSQQPTPHYTVLPLSLLRAFHVGDEGTCHAVFDWICTPGVPLGYVPPVYYARGRQGAVSHVFSEVSCIEYDSFLSDAGKLISSSGMLPMRERKIRVREQAYRLDERPHVKKTDAKKQDRAQQVLDARLRIVQHGKDEAIRASERVGFILWQLQNRRLCCASDVGKKCASPAVLVCLDCTVGLPFLLCADHDASIHASLHTLFTPHLARYFYDNESDNLEDLLPDESVVHGKRHLLDVLPL